jgi:hypothetical protein
MSSDGPIAPQPITMSSPDVPRRGLQIGRTNLPAIIWCVSCLCALVAYFALGRRAIVDIYYQRSLPVLNRLICHQDIHSAAYYQDRALVLLLCAFVLGIAGMALLRYFREVEALVSRRFRLIAILLYIPFSVYAAMTFIKPGFCSEPIANEDYAFHFTGSGEVVQHLLNRGTIWGYNPFLSAGKMSYGVDDVWSALVMLPFAWLHQPALLFNISVLIAFLLGPLLALGSVLLFKYERADALLFFVFAMLLDIGFLPIRGFYYTGGYGFPTANWLCLFLFGLTHHYIQNRSRVVLILLVILATLAVYIHPLSAVIFPLFFLPYAIANYRSFDLRIVASFAVSASVVLCASLVWVHRVLTPQSFAMDYPGLQTSPSLILATLRGDRAFLLLNVAFIISAILYGRQGNRAVVFAGAASYLSLLAIAFWGTQLRLGVTEPTRFIIPLGIFIAFFATPAIVRSFRSGKILLLVMILCLFLDLLRTPLQYQLGLPDQTADAILNVLQRPPKTGRLLIQEARLAEAQQHLPYFNSRCASLLAYKTSLETINDTWPFAKFEEMIADRVFGRTLGDFSAELFQQYLDLYNVRYILLYRPQERELMAKFPFLHEQLRSGRYTIIENISKEPTAIYRGAGVVGASYDRIAVTNAASPETILKYHYAPGLRATPSSVKVEPVKLMDDPVPFIRVHNGTCTSFVVEY